MENIVVIQKHSLFSMIRKSIKIKIEEALFPKVKKEIANQIVEKSISINNIDFSIPLNSCRNPEFQKNLNPMLNYFKPVNDVDLGIIFSKQYKGYFLFFIIMLLKQNLHFENFAGFGQKIFEFIVNSERNFNKKINTKEKLSSNSGGYPSGNPNENPDDGPPGPPDFLIFLLLAIITFLGLSLFLYRSKIRKILLVLLGGVDKAECFSMGEREKYLSIIQKFSGIQEKYEIIKLDFVIKLNQKTTELLKLLRKPPFNSIRVPEAFIDLIDSIFNLAQNFILDEKK